MRWVHFQINYFQTLLLFIFVFVLFCFVFGLVFFWGGVGVRTLYMYMMRWNNAIKDIFFFGKIEKNWIALNGPQSTIWSMVNMNVMVNKIASFSVIWKVVFRLVKWKRDHKSIFKNKQYCIKHFIKMSEIINYETQDFSKYQFKKSYLFIVMLYNTQL